MSEIITLNTETGTQKIEKVEPLPLFNDDHFMLREVMPEYDISKLPNSTMTNFIEKLKMTMKLYGGIGLSANQCGVMKRVFVMGTDEFIITCINPKVVSQSEEIVKDREGCLSFPGMHLGINRPKTIDVEFYDENGELKKTKFEGLTARCFLHELDHMNGVKFTERVGPVALRLAKQKQDKMIKKIKRGAKK